MSTSASGKAIGPEWVELAGRLRDRRLDLARFIDPEFANLSAFCRKRGLHYRTAADLEHARKDNYTRGTKYEAEEAYGLERGSIDQARAGGEFRAVPGSPPITPRVRYQLRAIGEYLASGDDDDGKDGDPDSASGSA